jgi:hypothetical protein
MSPCLSGALALTLVVSALGCSGEKRAGAPPREASEPKASPAAGLRPLTSRDGAKPFESTDAPASDALPPGHPPVGGVPARNAVTGIVSIAPEIQSRTSPTDILYLIARSRPTNAVVAVRRDEGVSFPHAFELSSADAMVADQPFAGPFDITARLSKTGDALPARGDLEGGVSAVAEGARKVSVVIDRIRE